MPTARESAPWTRPVGVRSQSNGDGDTLGRYSFTTWEAYDDR